MSVNRGLLLLFLLLVSNHVQVVSFAPTSCAISRIHRTLSFLQKHGKITSVSHGPQGSLGSTRTIATTSTATTTSLFMSSNDGSGGSGILPLLGAILIGGLFLSTSFLPMIGAGSGGPAPLANSVATRDQQQQQVVTNDQYRLSRAAIQEKLSVVPVFYIAGSNGEMETSLFLSYNDAKGVATGDKVVKVTTLDQVEYPLVLKRGRMRMAPPPVEVQKAEESLDEGKTYKLVPSKQALLDAAEFKIDLGDSDFPLFVADRLAFGNGNGGLQVPLFLEKADCLTSYSRLRGTNQNLPETPSIRSTTLNDEIFSMEKGTRPGMTQLAFYATAEDVNKAVEMLGE